MAATSALLSGCMSGEQPPHSVLAPSENRSAVPPTAEALQTADIQEVVKAGFRQYKQRFGCPVDVAIRTGPLPTEAGGELPLLPGSVFVVAAIGSPGQILINEKFESATKASPVAINVLHVAAHEAVHACQAAALTLDPAWKPKGQGLTINQVQGFTLIAREMLEGTTVPIKVHDIEEGAAEVLADEVAGPLSNTDEVAVNPPYYKLKQLTARLMEHSNMSTNELASLVQRNGLLEFLSRTSGVAKPTLDGDLFRLVETYESEIYGK